MSTDEYGGIEIALVVSIGALRRILRNLHVNGRHWWIASDPEDARETGWISVGWGDQHCTDVLNTQYFRLPILDSAQDGTPDKLLVLFDASVIVSEDRRFCSDVGDWENFSIPLWAALVTGLRAQTRQEEK